MAENDSFIWVHFWLIGQLLLSGHSNWACLNFNLRLLMDQGLAPCTDSSKPNIVSVILGLSECK